MLSRFALILTALALAAVAVAAGPAEHRPTWTSEPIVWKQSRSLGKPWAGRLVNGVQLPSEGEQFFTWDPILRTTPNRPWRRWGSDRLLRTFLHVLDDYFAAHPDAPRVAIGDLSRPQGGIFDERYGGIGHASHQNGRDIDIYYPRLDREERAPTKPSEVDRVLAQDLVNRFVRAGATNIFVGPRLALRGPRRIVEPLRHHDDHLHVRIRRDPRSGADARAIDSRAADRGCASRRSDCAAPHPRHRLHPWRRMRRSRSDAAARAGRAGGRRLDRPSPEPRRIRARPAAERARRRPEPELRFRVAADGPPLVAGVLRAPPFLGARVADRPPAHHRAPARRHDLVPPAPGVSSAPGARASTEPASTRGSPECGSRPSAGPRGLRLTGRTIASRRRRRTSSSCRQGR